MRASLPWTVKAGKRREINTMISMEVFEAIDRDSVQPSWTWLSVRWENQQRDGEVRFRCVDREFRSMDPTREGPFTPSSEPTTGRLIDFKAVKKGLLTVLLYAINACFNALQEGDVVVEPPREWLQAEPLKGNTTKTLWKLRKKLYGQRDASKGIQRLHAGHPRQGDEVRPVPGSAVLLQER